jgi:hypothetical protein
MLTLILTAFASDALDAELATLRQEQWLSSLDQTDYPDSPYTSPDLLPQTVEVETCWQGFNDYYYFALVDGHIWYKPRFKRPALAHEWRTDLEWKPFGLNEGLPYRLLNKDPTEKDTTFADGMRANSEGALFVEDLLFQTVSELDAPDFLDRAMWDAAGSWPHEEALEFDPDYPQVESIVCMTADDDEIAVVADTRQMFYRRKVSNIFVSTEWYDGWGQSKDLPVYFPSHLTGHGGWSIGRITAFGAGYKSGPDDRIFEWGPAAVSMETMVWLSPDGRIIYYLDSGTPPVVEHFVEAPFRGQWKGEGIDSSASTVMLIDRFGAVYTKIADFDLLGSTPTHPYCYFEECDDEVFYPAGDIRSGMSDIRLPAEDWLVHDPILPPIAWSAETWLSDRITIVPTGKGNYERELRVLGMQEGRIGTYYKKLSDDVWLFRDAPPGDLGFSGLEPLSEQTAFTDVSVLKDLHTTEPPLDRHLEGLVEVEGELLGFRVLDYNPMASPWHVEVFVSRPDGSELTVPVELHVVQAWNKFMDPDYGHHDAMVMTWETTLHFDWVEVMMAMGGAGGTAKGVALRSVLDSARNDLFGLLVNATENGLEMTAKKPRRTGEIHAVAIRPDAAEGIRDIDALQAEFWGQQNHHMGWMAEVAALEQNKPSSCDAKGLRWAAEVVELQERSKKDVKGVGAVKREARRFTRFTRGTSGFMYLSQLKTIDAALDATREKRGNELRPNELRFNVITGITSRIPFLSENIWFLQGMRSEFIRAEHKDLMTDLDPLLDYIDEMGC